MVSVGQEKSVNFLTHSSTESIRRDDYTGELEIEGFVVRCSVGLCSAFQIHFSHGAAGRFLWRLMALPAARNQGTREQQRPDQQNEEGESIARQVRRTSEAGSVLAKHRSRHSPSSPSLMQHAVPGSLF